MTRLHVLTSRSSIPEERHALQASRLYATRPHLAGSSQDLVTAKQFLNHLQRELHITPPEHEPIFEAGSHESRESVFSIPYSHEPRAWIDTYFPILSVPLDRQILIQDDAGHVEVELDLRERADDESDPDVAKHSDAIPTFHGHSHPGDVVGPGLDGGYCTKQEFDSLEERGISLNGTIVLCRNGYNFRGLKVKRAQELGAIGVLIFSDVKDDGTVTEANGYAPYPRGPARNPTSVQRGGVQFVSMYPGDPTTPGYPSYRNSTRTSPKNVPDIPSLPISWENACALLRTLTPGDPLQGKKIRLINNAKTSVTPIWNVMAVIPGHIPSEVVVLGNHRDAWVLGATDPSSGTASLHEVIRGFGALLARGWKPLRTILIASWDAEEYGLVGSTEWGEDFTKWINQHVVAYLNLDSSAFGSRLSYGASPLLAHLVKQVAEELPHPTELNRTLWDARNDDGNLFGQQVAPISVHRLAMESVEAASVDAIGVNALGSGSDFTVFLQRIGVPSTNGGFRSTFHDPVYHYHSVFDSQRWQELYGDPGFHRHVAIAKHFGLQALRISDSVVLPFNTTHYTSELMRYLDRVENLAVQASINVSFTELRATIEILHQASLKLDREKENVQAQLEQISLTCKQRQLHGLQQRLVSGKMRLDEEESQSQEARKPLGLFAQMDDHAAYHQALAAASSGSYRACFDGRVNRARVDSWKTFGKLKAVARRIQTVNNRLIAFERGFISKDGIKDREWFRHLGVAPGKWLGYGATTLPSLTEAITLERNATLVKEEAERLRKLLIQLSAATLV